MTIDTNSTTVTNRWQINKQNCFGDATVSHKQRTQYNQLVIRKNIVY